MTTRAADEASVMPIAMVTWTAMIVALVAIVLFVALGVYRARHSAAREANYRTLAEQTGAAQQRSADSARITADELTALRAELQANRAELGQLAQRLAGLERLLSQIG